MPGSSPKEPPSGHHQTLYLYLTLTLVLLLTNVPTSAINSFTPRGVPLSRAALYDPQKDFSCLDGSKLIPFSFVNDDYCDCKDGSDEPGTSACNKGSFYCLNAGHVSAYLRSSKVGDGVCDCCDGSDELTACPNTCASLGRAAREENERLEKLSREGYQKRLELSKVGKELRKEKENEKDRLEEERQRAEVVKVEKGQLKELAEAPEKAALDKYEELEKEKRRLEEEEASAKSDNDATKLFNMLDSNQDGLLTIEELKTRSTFDKDKDGQVTEEEAMFFLNMETEMGREEWVKVGYSIAKPFFLLEEGAFQPPDSDREEEHHEDHNEEEQHQYEDDEADDLQEQREFSEDEGVDASNEQEEPPPSPSQPPEEKYDEATRFLISEADHARSEYNEADRVLREVVQKLQDLNDLLNLDFGDDERFASMHGQCYDFEDREYVYSLCPFKEATQRGKSGGSHVNLGKWGEWSGSENKHSEMLYNNGQGCWNGPARSARVKLSCGLENKVTSVSEPSRCEYHMEFESPTACDKLDLKGEGAQGHDEL